MYDQDAERDSLEGTEEKLESAYLDPSLKVKGKEKAIDGGSKRMFKLTVTDGLNIFHCIEYQNWSLVKEVIVGSKYQLAPTADWPLIMRRGILQVSQPHLRLICKPEGGDSSSAVSKEFTTNNAES